MWCDSIESIGEFRVKEVVGSLKFDIEARATDLIHSSYINEVTMNDS